MIDARNEHDQTLPLQGALVIEDGYYIADDLRRALDAAGARVVGPVSTIEKANDLIEAGEFDCAVIDLNLHGQSAVPIADRLIDLGKSFAIATGYGSDMVPKHLKGVPRIEKPFDPPALVRLITTLSCGQG